MADFIDPVNLRPEDTSSLDLRPEEDSSLDIEEDKYSKQV